MNMECGSVDTDFTFSDITALANSRRLVFMTPIASYIYDLYMNFNMSIAVTFLLLREGQNVCLSKPVVLNDALQMTTEAFVCMSVHTIHTTVSTYIRSESLILALGHPGDSLGTLRNHLEPRIHSWSIFPLQI